MALFSGPTFLQVPFSMMALLDAVKKKSIPADIKCRQVTSCEYNLFIRACRGKTIKYNFQALNLWSGNRCFQRVAQDRPPFGMHPTSAPCRSGWMNSWMQNVTQKCTRWSTSHSNAHLPSCCFSFLVRGRSCCLTKISCVTGSGAVCLWNISRLA